MSSMSRVLVILAVAVLTPVSAVAQPLDNATQAAIRDAGLRGSQVMDHISWLSDVYGPRVTGTPAIEQARVWTMAKLREWGLANVHEERFAFGHGWSLERFHAHMVEPQVMPIIGYPKSWSSGTDGTVTAEVTRADIHTAADFEKYRGALRGRIVLPQPAREVQMLEGDLVLRMTDAQLAEASQTQVPPPARARRPERAGPGRPSFTDQLQQFYLEEGVVAVLDRGSDSVMMGAGSGLPYQTQRTDGGTIFVGRGGPRDEHAGNVVPSVTLAVEHYNRMVRILDKDVPVRVELNIETTFHAETDAAGQMNAFNILAEIPGSDLADEVVMIGAHFDTIHAGTGATDNAAGVAAMMEVMRILQTIGARPRRTIRLALWGAEELGAARFARLCQAAFRRPADDAVAPGARDALGLLQPRQRVGQVAGHLAAGELRGCAGVRGVDRGAARSGCDHARAAECHWHRPHVLRCGWAARVPVYPGPSGVQRAYPSFEHGRGRPGAA